MKLKSDKWLNGVLPALLIHLSIGSIYAFSLLVKPLAKYMMCTEEQIQICFSLIILCFGITAAFVGPKLEEKLKNISTFGGFIFIIGLFLTSLLIKYKILWMFYITCGVLCGVGLGILYLTPCKTLMLYFEKHKGLGIGLGLMGFGFGETLAAPLIVSLLEQYPNNLEKVFMCLALVYFIPLLIGDILLTKPEILIKSQKDNFSYIKLLKDKFFIISWIMFFLHIHCGLSIISVASPMMSEMGANTMFIALVIAIMGLCNGGGRMFFGTISDHIAHRSFMYLITLGISIVSIYSYVFLPNIFTLGLLLCGISAFYGAGFTLIAPLLADKYGMEHISAIHGLILTAWAIAGITGNNMSVIIHYFTGSYELIYSIIGMLYMVALLCSVYLVFNNKNIE